MILNRIIGVIPIYSKKVQNQFIEDLETVNVTGIFTTEQNDICILKYKSDKEPVLNDLFNQTYDSKLIDSNDFDWIFCKTINNIDIYLLYVKNKEIISTKTSYNIQHNSSNNKLFFWKTFVDSFKEEESTENNNNIYQDIIKGNSEYSNTHLNEYTLISSRYKINMKLREIYHILSEWYLQR